MTTATGDFAVDYSAAANVSPLTNASLTYIGTDRLQVLSNAVKDASGSFGALWRYNGSMGSGVIRSKLEIANNSNGDFLVCAIIDSSGNGYGLWSSGTACTLYKISAGAQGSSLGTSGTIAGTSGNILTLELNQTTHTLVSYENGGIIAGPGAVDTTTTAGLAFGYRVDAQNSNSTTFRSLSGDGIASGGSVLLLTSRLTGGLRELTGHLS